MSDVIRFDENPEIFQNIVLFYRADNGKFHIGSTNYYNGRGVADDWLSVLYEEPLPEENGIIMGWNWLDDNSALINLVPTDKAATGIEDFLYAHGLERDWKSIDYVVIRSYPDIEKYFETNTLDKGSAIGFGIRKTA